MIESILKDIEELKKRTTRPLVTAGINMVLEIIKKHSKNNGWIPCSEQLPEVEISDRTKSGICSDNGQSFLITDTEGYVYESTFYAVAHKFEDDAIAWQPLPEAYHE